MSKNQKGQKRKGNYAKGKDHPKYKRSYTVKGELLHSANAVAVFLGMSYSTVVRRAKIGMYG